MIITPNYLPVGMKTNQTARIRQPNAARWFHCSFSPWNINNAMTVNTVSVITSCNTLSCISVNGPPFSTYPIRLAGTWKAYSNSATPHEKSITAYNGQFLASPVDWSFRCPYHAKVMNTLEITSNRIVSNWAFIS